MAKPFLLLEPGPREPPLLLHLERQPPRPPQQASSAHRIPTAAAAAAAALCPLPLPCSLAAVAPDEPHQRGDSHLLEAHSLGNIAGHVLSGRMVPGDYQSKVLCLTDWRRRGTAYDLAPLAHQLPSSNPPDFKPLPKDTLKRALSLQPGGCRLTEVRSVGGQRPGEGPGLAAWAAAACQQAALPCSLPGCICNAPQHLLACIDLLRAGGEG